MKTTKALLKLLFYSIMLRLSNRNIFEITITKCDQAYLLKAYSLRKNLITTKKITL
jgi:hypothetical protein